MEASEARQLRSDPWDLEEGSSLGCSGLDLSSQSPTLQCFQNHQMSRCFQNRQRFPNFLSLRCSRCLCSDLREGLAGRRRSRLWG